MKSNKNSKDASWRVVYILSAVLIVSIIVTIVAFCIPKKTTTKEFVPPSFDAAAVQGVPEVPENLGYSSPYQDGMAYRFSVCGNVTMDGKTATVYLTNAAENDVYLKLRILDAKGNMLGETGLIKAGEYVKTVELSKELAVGTPIKLKIMGYEPDTYNSAGSAVLNTTIGGADN